MIKIPRVIAKIAEDKEVVALYALGSLAEENLKPLSDLDIGILLSDSLDKQDRFKKSIDLMDTFAVFRAGRHIGNACND